MAIDISSWSSHSQNESEPRKLPIRPGMKMSSQRDNSTPLGSSKVCELCVVERFSVFQSNTTAYFVAKKWSFQGVLEGNSELCKLNAILRRTYAARPASGHCATSEDLFKVIMRILSQIPRGTKCLGRCDVRPVMMS